ncbi:hypothetical protein ZOSMA_123G00410 [Zostera marina]|uniref:Uncharacterized protein n=1 Tax=Zostera marina TaxID=29655 RepID=A0A0K9Q075_ZOSMR|nr:hypothetical protein ZOSMA_123G00410 [Zostera marina]
MDFHSFSRRTLQGLCKKNKIPANMTNVAMAEALENLPTVDGMDEIQDFMTPMKKAVATPKPTTNALRSSARISARKTSAPVQGQSVRTTRRTAMKKVENIGLSVTPHPSTDLMMIKKLEDSMIDAPKQLEEIGEVVNSDVLEIDSVIRKSPIRVTDDNPAESCLSTISIEDGPNDSVVVDQPSFDIPCSESIDIVIGDALSVKTIVGDVIAEVQVAVDNAIADTATLVVAEEATIEEANVNDVFSKEASEDAVVEVPIDNAIADTATIIVAEEATVEEANVNDAFTKEASEDAVVEVAVDNAIADTATIIVAEEATVEEANVNDAFTNNAIADTATIVVAEQATVEEANVNDAFTKEASEDAVVEVSVDNVIAADTATIVVAEEATVEEANINDAFTKEATEDVVVDNASMETIIDAPLVSDGHVTLVDEIAGEISLLSINNDAESFVKVDSGEEVSRVDFIIVPKEPKTSAITTTQHFQILEENSQQSTVTKVNEAVATVPVVGKENDAALQGRTENMVTLNKVNPKDMSMRKLKSELKAKLAMIDDGNDVAKRCALTPVKENMQKSSV